MIIGLFHGRGKFMPREIASLSEYVTLGQFD